MYYLADRFATLPKALDPDRHRIICQHFFGIDPEELREVLKLTALIDGALASLSPPFLGL